MKRIGSACYSQKAKIWHLIDDAGWHLNDEINYTK